jgi:class 3 adenylate cyclase
VDAHPNDGWGATFPVRGREIEATVLFSDITAFSRRTLDLSPAETLIFVNWFFTWVTAEALRGGKGIIDKYIGNEMMIVFSPEFGSEDPFAEAVHTASWMANNDVWSFGPHVGLASGQVIVGYVGTPLKYDCSVFGAPVALAARCAGVHPATTEPYSTAIISPAKDWDQRNLDEVLPPRDSGQEWELLPTQTEPLKNVGDVDVRAVVRQAMWFPNSSPEQAVKEGDGRHQEAGSLLALGVAASAAS